VLAVFNDWKQRYAPGTLHRRAYGLRKALSNFREVTGYNLAPCVPRTRDAQQRTTTATPQQLDDLWNAARPIERLWLTLTLNTALRRSDVLRLAPRHVDTENRTITITQKKTGDPVTIPINDTLLQLLNGAPGDPTDNSTPYLTRWHGRPVSKDSVATWWKLLRRRAGIPPGQSLTPHDLRRTTAALVFEKTQHDIRAVQALLGHRSLSSTLRYLGPHDPNRLRSVLAELWKPMPTKAVQ